MIREDNYDWKYRMTYVTSLLEKIADAVTADDKKMECPICGNKASVFAHGSQGKRKRSMS